MSEHLTDDVSPRAIMLAQEINRQCDQILAIIATTLTDISAQRADTVSYHQIVAMNQP